MEFNSGSPDFLQRNGGAVNAEVSVFVEIDFVDVYNPVVVGLGRVHVAVRVIYDIQILSVGRFN